MTKRGVAQSYRWIGSGNIGLDEADATLKLIEGDTLTDDDVTGLMPPTGRWTKPLAVLRER